MHELLTSLIPPVQALPVVALLWAIGIGAIYNLFRHRKWLDHEQLELLRAHALVGETAPTAPAKDPAAGEDFVRPAPSVLERIGGELPGSLSHKIAELLDGQKTMKSPDLEAVYSAAEEIAEARWAFARMAPNLVMLLGLCGTVIGLSYIVHDIAPIIKAATQSYAAANAASNQSPLAPLEQLETPVALLGSAFASTLHGIVCAVTITLYATSIERRQAAVLSSLRSFLLQDLARLILPETLESEIRTLGLGLIGALRALSSTLSVNIEALKDSIGQSVVLMQGITTGINTAAVELSGATKNASAKLDEVSATVSRSAEQLAASMKASEQLQIEIHQTYAALMNQHELAHSSFKDQAGQMITAVDEQRSNFNTNTAKTLDLLLAVQTTFQSGAEKFETAGELFRNMSLTVGERSYQAIAERADRFLEAVDRHTRSTQLLEGQLTELMSRLDPRLLPREEWDAVVSALEKVAQAVSQKELAPAISLALRPASDTLEVSDASDMSDESDRSEGTELSTVPRL